MLAFAGSAEQGDNREQTRETLRTGINPGMLNHGK